MSTNHETEDGMKLDIIEMTQSPNLVQGPEPVETAELHFKLFCKLKIFETETKYEEGHCGMLAVSQYYGLIFVGNCNGFSVIKTKSLTPSTDPEKFPKKDVVLNLRPTHISVDFTQKILAVVCSSKPGSVLIFYNIQSFSFKDVTPLKVAPVAKLVQNLVAEVVDLTWQPNADGNLMFCMSDGSVLALEHWDKDWTVFTLPSTTQATCFCWSPKGKQIVIGSANGTLSQYKPDLKVVKTLPSPPLFNGAAMVVSVLWISSFQFAVAYNDRANPESFPVITIVNAAKNEPLNFINYDDITYSSTLFRNHQIYMTHQSAWNLIFVSSANSIEVAVLHLKDNLSWEQWLLGDASRAELPLNPDRQETFPLGWAFDLTSQEAIPWGEGTLPPMPRLLIVSDEGLLCIFNVINVAQGAPQVCAPPEESLDDSLFVISTKNTTLSSDPTKSTLNSKSLLGSPPAFGNSRSTFAFESSPGFGSIGTKPQTMVPQAVPLILQQQQEYEQQQQQQQQQQHQQQPPPPPPPPSSSPQQQELQPQTHTQVQRFPFSTFHFQPQLSLGTHSTSLLSTKSTTTGNATAPNTSSQQGVKPPTAQGDLLADRSLPQLTPTKSSETSVEKIPITPALTNKKPDDSVEPVEKTDVPEQRESHGTDTSELATVDDSVYLSALQEEIEHFNSELQQLSAKVGNLVIKVGSEEDKAKIKKSIDNLYDFWKELKETTEGQTGEIHAVVMDLMEAFAWLEDAKSRNLQRKNPSYIELKKSEELDPLNARHMDDIAHLKYYIENQLKQLSSYLEKEWMDHQENHRSEIKNRMAVPRLEEMYKTMHYQLKILHKQKSVVEELKEKIAKKKRKNKFQNLLTFTDSSVSTQNNGNRISELSKLAENLLQLKISKEENSPHTGTWEIMKAQLKAISERSMKLTKEKQTALRDALSECDMIKIRPVKTSLESSTFLRSLALEKNSSKALKFESEPKSEGSKEKSQIPSEGTNVIDRSEVKFEAKPKAVFEKPKGIEKVTTVTKAEVSKTVNVPVETIITPFTEQFGTKLEEKSPLTSLSGIVSSIGKKNEAKPQATFVFGSSNFQKSDSGKDIVSFGSPKLETKQEEPKTSQTFTFGISKPNESVFSKKEPTVFVTKPVLSLTNSTPIASSKPDLTITTTPNVVVSPVAATSTAPVSSSFNFTVANSVGLPKMNLFSGKEQSSGFGTLSNTENFFSTPPTTTQSSAPSVFGMSTSIFGNSTKSGTNTFVTSTSFGVPKTSIETPIQSSNFGFVQVVENNSTNTTSATVEPTSETEVIDVVKIDEPVQKSETPSEKSKDSPKTTVSTSIFESTPTPLKIVCEVTTTSASISVTAVSTLPSSVTTTNVFAKPVVTTVQITSNESSSTVAVSSGTAATVKSSAFSFSMAMAQTAFGLPSTTTTTTTTTTASLFNTPTKTTDVYEQQVSSKTATTNIFGGSTPSIPTSNIFGESTPTKSVFGQVATPSTTSESIFGSSTPTTSTFGQVSAASPQTSFGQKSDSVSETANIFCQLLTDTNRPVFGTSSATPTTANNIFNSPKNLFGGGANTTTASLFGTTSSSLFPQTTSVFGQPTTSSNVFGQSQPSTSMSFFGQNICSPFGGGTSVTSNQSSFESGGFNKPIFGQSVFGQTTSNTSVFGGSSSSVFGGTSSTTSSNVFQTPTTSTTFGTTSPGPFSGGTRNFGENSFGSNTSTFQKPLGGFGSAPVFGGGPAFGGSPTFGGSSSFGSLPTFGSRSQVSGTFGQTTGSATFGNLANQNTVSFGNLAQQSQSQGFRGSSFENKSVFGGSSFSSWRSK